MGNRGLGLTAAHSDFRTPKASEYLPFMNQQTIVITQVETVRGLANCNAIAAAGERTVKNWLAGNSGPNGQHLVDLIRHSDRVLEVLLVLAGRQQIAAAQRLLDVRNKLAETVELVDTLMGEGDCTR
jgi:hypothetical protein